MFSNSKFRDEAKDIAKNIDGKRFSDYGMMWNELSLRTGIPRSILERYDDWYFLDNGLYYFKDKHVITELFISELAHECCVRCVDFLLAVNDNKLGIISKLYREQNKKYYMYSDFCKEYFHHVPDYLGVFKLSATIAFGDDIAQKLMEDIFSVMSLDILCGQWDREEYNLFFECDCNGVRVAPLCDNGISFQRGAVYVSPFGNFNLEEDKISRGTLPFILANDIYFYNRLVLVLDIDVEMVLNRCCEKYRIDITQEDKDEVLKYFDKRKRLVEHTLKLSRNKY